MENNGIKLLLWLMVFFLLGAIITSYFAGLF